MSHDHIFISYLELLNYSIIVPLLLYISCIIVIYLINLIMFFLFLDINYTKFSKFIRMKIKAYIIVNKYWYTHSSCHLSGASNIIEPRGLTPKPQFTPSPMSSTTSLSEDCKSRLYIQIKLILY